MPTLETPAEVKRDGWPDDDWAAVRSLIAEVQQTERTEHYADVVHQWDELVRLFRRVERQQLFERTPTEEDLAFHEATLYKLIGMGQFLALRVKGISDAELAGFGIQRLNLLAYVQELQETL
jgi:gamma-glutamylcysteine synthetase